MEANKPLTQEQLKKLKETIDQRFGELYERIGTNRQKLATTVLLAHQSINKELVKEKIDGPREKAILREVKEIEKTANNQLPHFHKIVAPSPLTTEANIKADVAKPKNETKPKSKKK